jgi:hypothetical protein
MTISDLLSAARREHELYRASVPHMRGTPGGKLQAVSGNADESIAHLTEALRLRLEADANDPQHLDLAWAQDVAARFRHNDVVAWYQERLAEGPSAGESRRLEHIQRMNNGQA